MNQLNTGKTQVPRRRFWTALDVIRSKRYPFIASPFLSIRMTHTSLRITRMDLRGAITICSSINTLLYSDACPSLAVFSVKSNSDIVISSINSLPSSMRQQSTDQLTVKWGNCDCSNRANSTSLTSGGIERSDTDIIYFSVLIEKPFRRVNRSETVEHFRPRCASWQVEQQNIKHRLFDFSGDERNNEQPGLTVLHTIFMREHNRIADKLTKINIFWDDERIFQVCISVFFPLQLNFQESRRIMTAKLQHITYSEWLPIVLGWETMEKYELNPLRSGYFKGELIKNPESMWFWK